MGAGGIASAIPPAARAMNATCDAMLYHVATRWYPLGVYLDLAYWVHAGAWWDMTLGLN